MTARLTAEREAEIRARLAARTPGDWQAGRDDMQSYHAGTGEAYTAIYADNPEGRFHLGHRLPFVVARAYDESGRNKEDARFIANAPADMDVLLAEVDALRYASLPNAHTDLADALAERDALREALRTITRDCGAEYDERDITADGIPFGAWERGFNDCARVIEARARAIDAARTTEANP